MSVYTTEVRYICETAYGLNGSERPRPGINTIVNAERVQSSVFDFEYPLFDEDYRPVLQSKILKHYYTREIGEETVELWKLRLDTRLNEIMPYYNKLYTSELIEFNPLYNVNYTRQGNRAGESSSENHGTSQNTENTGTNNTNVRTPNLTDERTLDLNTHGTQEETKTAGTWDLYSDTPQGGIDGIENAQTGVAGNGYLTDARHVYGDGEPNNLETDTDNTGTDTMTHTGTETDVFTGSVQRTANGLTNGTEAANTTEEYLENVAGWQGANPNQFLADYRNNFLNIDLQIINDLSDLFMNIWE